MFYVHGVCVGGQCVETDVCVKKKTCIMEEKLKDRECHSDWWVFSFTLSRSESELRFLLHCLLFPAGENGNSQHWTNTVNTTPQKKAERNAFCSKAKLMEGVVGDSWSMSGFIYTVWQAALWQLCSPQSILLTVHLITVSQLFLSPHCPLILSYGHTFPLFPVLTMSSSVSHPLWAAILQHMALPRK